MTGDQSPIAPCAIAGGAWDHEHRLPLHQQVRRQSDDPYSQPWQHIRVKDSDVPVRLEVPIGQLLLSASGTLPEPLTAPSKLGVLIS